MVQQWDLVSVHDAVVQGLALPEHQGLCQDHALQLYLEMLVVVGLETGIHSVQVGHTAR